MIVSHLELVDFRNYASGTFELTSGTTAVIGDNGQGKTNLAEALAFLATLSSFRSVPGDALVRVGASTAIIRATVRDDDGRESLIEIELAAAGRNRVQVNRQRLQRVRDLLGTVRVTVFSPDDLILVKGSPGERRRFLDDTLVALAVKYDTIRLEIDRIVRQRNTLLKQAGGRLTDEIEVTLDVWDMKFADIADQFGYARSTLVGATRPDGPGGLRTTGRHADADRSRLRTSRGVRAVSRLHSPRHVHSTSVAGSAPSDPIATNSTWRSADSRAVPTPRRASSGPWRSPSDSPATDSSPNGPAPRRCSSSTTSCRNSTTTAPRPCSTISPPAR